MIVALGADHRGLEARQHLQAGSHFVAHAEPAREVPHTQTFR